MVYKKFIKRDGKVFGPYYYESYRDSKGHVKTRFISGPKKTDKINLFSSKKMLLVLGIILVVILILFLGNLNYNPKTTGRVIDLSPSFSEVVMAEQLANNSISSNVDVRDSVDLLIKSDSSEGNSLMEFNTSNSSIELNFNLLDYSSFEANNVEDILPAENFNISVNESKEKYKWGYNVKLSDLNFIARIDVTSNQTITVINNQTLRIGEAYLSFADLASQGYTLSINSPVLLNESLVVNETIVINKTNVTEMNVSNITEVVTNISIGNESSGEIINITNETIVISNESEGGENISVGNESVENVTVGNETTEVVNETESEAPFNESTQEDSSEDDNISEVLVENISESEDTGVIDVPIVEETPVTDEVPAEEPLETAQPTVTEEVVNTISGFVVHGVYGLTGFVVDDSETDYENTVSVYVQKNFNGTEYNIGDVINLDPSLVFFEQSAPGNIDSCQTLDTPGIYNLTRSLSGTMINMTGCFNITTSNVTLDCNNYYISNNSINSAGIYAANAYNITIRNCNVTMNISTASSGIKFVNVQRSVITNNSLYYNQFGIYLYSSSENNITYNKVAYSTINSWTTGSLFIYYNSDNNTIAHNNVSQNRGGNYGMGITVQYAKNNTIYNNTAIGNSFVGIFGYNYANNNHFIGNIVKNINGFGIAVQQNCYNNNMDNNMVTGITGNGQAMNIITSSNNNTMNNNNVSFSPTCLLILFGSKNNTVSNNSVFNCTSVGIIDQNSSNNFIFGNNVTRSLFGIDLAYVTSDNVYSNTLYNNTIGFQIEDPSSYNNTVRNLTIINNSDDSFTLYYAGKTYSSNIYIESYSDASGDGIVPIYSASNSLFRDSIIVTNVSVITKFVLSSSNNTFLNVSYDSSKESIESGSSLVRKWYYSSYVNDTFGNPVDLANLSIYSAFNVFQYSSLTNSSGRVNYTAIAEYTNSGGTRIFPSNYTVYVFRNNSGIVSKRVNLTSFSANIFDDPITLSNELSSCQTINIPGKFDLVRNISGTEIPDNGCFNFTVSNLTFDCHNNYIMNYSNLGSAFYAANVSNITIKNCNISMNYSFGSGIYLDYVNNSFLINNTISSSYNGVYIYSGFNNNLTANRLNSDTNGIFIKNSSNNSITNNILNLNVNGLYLLFNSSNNSFINNTLNSNTLGINLSQVSNNNLTNNSLNSNGWGILLYGSNRNILVNNNLWNCTNSSYGCLSLYNSDNNSVTRGVINLSYGNLIYFGYTPLVGSDNNFFANLTLINSSNYDVYIDSESYNNTFLNVSYASEGVVSGGQLIRKWYYRTYINDSFGNSVSGDVYLYNSSNSLEGFLSANSSGWTGFIPVTEYVNHNSFIDYSSNYTILSRKNGLGIGLKKFNLSDYSNNILDDSNTIDNVLDYCGTISVPGVYNMSRSFLGAEIFPNTCFNITESNVTLDCNNYYLFNFSTNSTGIFAGNESSIYNITIFNCNISIGQGGNGTGIGFSNVNRSLIFNSSINSNNLGIYLNSNSSHNFFYNILFNWTYGNNTFISGSSKNNTFLNVSYDSLKEYVESGSSLIREWYYRAYVNGTAGEDASGVTVTALNSSLSQMFQVFTNETGWTTVQVLSEYTNDGSKNYHIYWINASNLTDNDGHYYNVTAHFGNYFFDVFTLNDTSVPGFDDAFNSHIYVCEGNSLSNIFNVNDVDWDIPDATISPQDPFYIRLYSTINTTTNQYQIYSGILSKEDAGGFNSSSKTYNETITVRDEVNTNRTSVNITVIAINERPIMESLPESYNVFTGDRFYHPILVNDTEDGDQSSGNLYFNMTISGGHQFFDINNSGILNIPTNSSIVGSYTIEVCATDKGISNPSSNISLCGQDGTSLSECKSFILNIAERGTDGGDTNGGRGGGGSGGGGSGGTPGTGQNSGDGDRGNGEDYEGDFDITFNQTTGSSNLTKCGGWSECKVTYGLEEIIDNIVFLKGERSRECYDSLTGSYKTEKKLCTAGANILVNSSTDCYQDSVTILNENNEVVSRLQLIAGPHRKLNIQIFLNKDAYCPYCYDHVKNYDETDVDCGGSCATCAENPIRVYSNFGAILFFILIVTVLICGNLVVLLVTKYYMLRAEIGNLKNPINNI